MAYCNIADSSFATLRDMTASCIYQRADAVINMSETEDLLREAAEKIRKEAYAAGWSDCAAAVAKALAEAKPEDAQDIDLGASRREFNGGAGGRVANVQDGPMIGTTPYFVLQAVLRKPGMTGAEVVTAVHGAGHTVADPQIRTALSRLQKRNPALIVNRHKKWFPN
jgi:hypothetical protein